MRILFVSYFYEYNFGGAEPVARALRAELVKRGDTVDVLCLAGGPITQPEKIWRLPVPVLALRHLQIAKKILLFLNNSAFDNHLLKKAQGLPMPLQSYDIIHCQDAFCLAVGARLAVFAKKPLALTLHDNYPRRIIDDLTHPTATKVLQWIVRRRDSRLKSCFRQCRWIATVSNHVRENLIAYLEPNPPAVFTIYNPYPANLSRNIHSNAPASPPRILFIGRLSKDKGIDLILDALKQYDQPVQLTVLGLDGPLRGEVERAAARDARIRIEPPVPYEKVHRFFQENDLILCPSSWDEPFGLTVLEARIHGKPVLTTNRGGIPEILTGYTKALILNTKGLPREQVVQALRDALSPALALGKIPLDAEAEHRFLHRFSTESFADQYTALYRRGFIPG